MSERNKETVWTPELVRKTIQDMSAPFDAMPRGPTFDDEFRRACVKLTPEERSRLALQMQVLCTAAEHIRALIRGWGSPNLLGSGAEKTEVMSLLSAVDPKKLSIDVIDSLCTEVSYHLGAWTALPPKLFRALCDRMDEQEEQFAADEEAEAEAAREAKNGRTH